MVDINKYITKSDMLFFQNEVFGDLKNIEASVNTKLSKLNENITNITKEYTQKFDYFSNKIKDLLDIMSVNNIDHEKVEELYRNKDKIKDQITENKNRISQYKKILDSSLYKYDRAIIDNLELPGVIGHNCKFNNLRQFLDYTNVELNSTKLFKTQQIGELNLMKEKIDKFNQRIEFANKEVIQKCDFLYTNKFVNFKRELDKKFEEINIPVSAPVQSSPINIDFSPLEQEIKKNEELSNQIKEDIEKEINEIKNDIKNNKGIIDANYVIINKQKDELLSLKGQIDEINKDFKNFKTLSIAQNENKIIYSRNVSNNKKLTINQNYSNKLSLKYKNNQKPSFSDNLKENNNENEKKIIKKKSNKINNEDLKHITEDKPKEKRKISSITNENKKNNDIKNTNDTIKKPNRIKKKQKSLINKKNKINDEYHIHDFDSNEDEKIFKRKISKKILTYCFKSNLKLEKNENIFNNILDLSSNSFSSLEEKVGIKKFDKNSKKNEKLNIEFINEKINSTLSNKYEINKKINKNVSKLIKLKPIEKPIKLNMNNINEKTMPTNNENLNINTNNSGIKNKEKTVGFSINVFNKCKIQNKNNINTYNSNISNTNEKSNTHRKLNLTDKELLKSYLDKLLKDNKKYNSLSNALYIKNYKNAFTSANQNEIKFKDSTDLGLGLNDSQKNSNEQNNYSRNDSNNCSTSPLNRNNNISSLYKTTSFFKNNNDYNSNDVNILNGFLTSVPMVSQSQNEKEDEEKVIINKKIKIMNNKLNQIHYNIKIIIKRLNLLEINYKPLNSQLNDILMIILLIYKYFKKKSNNNTIKYDFFDISNIKFPPKNINFKKFKGFSSNNKSKNYLYTANGINLEEGGLYKTGQTKKELDIILKKIEPFLIKQFKDTI